MGAEPTMSLAGELRALDTRINELLPPQYQHSYASVSPESMGSAGLKYDADGRVAWGDVWTSFCELALAGGPPHRGSLLEPVARDDAMADPARTAEVGAEIARAIGLTTGLPVAADPTPGWVGVACATEAQAAWLQFAVTAENVSARRIGSTLKLPAGPAFRLEKEIKNVVVSLSKSHHYWDSHLTDTQKTLADVTIVEPATPDDVSASPADARAAATEVERRIHAAGRPTMPRRYAGWVGIQCGSVDECVWMHRAILADRVLARREGVVLFLPVGTSPDPDHADRVGDAFQQARRLWEASATTGQR